MMKMQTLQIQTTTACAKRDDWLAELRGAGLEPAAIGWTDDDSPSAARALEAIIAWVRAWRAAAGDRQAMERQGFRFPPVEPDCDPDQDWYRFSRWMKREPLFWRYEADFGVLPAAEGLADDQIGDLLNGIENRLASRGISVELAADMPEREVYRWLREELRVRVIDYLHERTHLTFDGCGGDCDTCFQRRWCPLALDLAEVEA